MDETERTYRTMAGKSIGKCSSGHWLPLKGDCDLCALDNALSFYNEAAPDQKVMPSDYGYQRLVNENLHGHELQVDDAK